MTKKTNAGMSRIDFLVMLVMTVVLSTLLFIEIIKVRDWAAALNSLVVPGAIFILVAVVIVVYLLYTDRNLLKELDEADNIIYSEGLNEAEKLHLKDLYEQGMLDVEETIYRQAVGERFYAKHHSNK